MFLQLALCICTASLPLPPQVTDSPTASANVPSTTTTYTDLNQQRSTTTLRPTKSTFKSMGTSFFRTLLKRLSRSTTEFSFDQHSHYFTDINSTCTGTWGTTTTTAPPSVAPRDTSGDTTVNAPICPWTQYEEYEADRIPQYILVTKVKNEGCTVGGLPGSCRSVRRQLKTFVLRGCFNGNKIYTEETKTVPVSYYCEPTQTVSGTGWLWTGTYPGILQWWGMGMGVGGGGGESVSRWRLTRQYSTWGLLELLF